MDDPQRELEARYLAATDQRGGSGFRGDADRWERLRRPIAAAIDRDGDLLDVGCANGHLLECLVDWTGADGQRIVPYGLDVPAALVARARDRLPRWSNHLYVADVFDEFTGTVHARAREGIPVLADIGEALSLVDDEATTCGAFDESELRRVHGPDYDERGIDVLGRRWASARQSLDAAIADADLDAVESELTVLGDLNGTLARLSAERYLRQLEALTHQV